MQLKLEFIQQKAEWCQSYIHDTINQPEKLKTPEDDNINFIVADLYRRCRIVLRRYEILKEKYFGDIPDEELNEINEEYKLIRFELYPQTINKIKQYKL